MDMLVCLVALMSNEGRFSLVSLMSKDYEGLFDWMNANLNLISDLVVGTLADMHSLVI